MEESSVNLVKLEALLEGFHNDGTYIHGYVTNETSVNNAVEIYRRVTATTFSVRTSTSLNFEPNKAEKGKFSTRSIKFSKSSCPNLKEDGVPFMHGGRKILECQFGPKREHEKKSNKDESPTVQTSEDMEHDYTPTCGPVAKRKRLNIRGTRKNGCQAKISIVQVCRFPEYAVTSKKCISIQQIQLKEKLLQDLNDGKVVMVENRFYIDLPLEKAHSNHPMGGLSVMTQTVHPQIIQWIDELVGEGMTDALEIQAKLRHFVNTKMSDTAAPNLLDRGYYPKLRDIKNHIYRAKVRRRITKLGRDDITDLVQDHITDIACSEITVLCKDTEEHQVEPDDCADTILTEQCTVCPDDDGAIQRQRAELLVELDIIRRMVHHCTNLTALQRLTEDTKAMQQQIQPFLDEPLEGLTSTPSTT